MDKPVINNTGLKGYYDFQLKLTARDFQTMWLWAVIAGGANIPPEAVGGVADHDELRREDLDLDREIGQAFDIEEPIACRAPPEDVD